MTSALNINHQEDDRSKLIQAKCQALLKEMLQDEANRYCVDCDARNPQWASWNLGVFLCVRCAGIHRRLGNDISRIKSLNFDLWTPEQVVSLKQMGNARARAAYEARLPDGYCRPQTDAALESFIRARFEFRKYVAPQWTPPSLPEVDWDDEIDEELDKQNYEGTASISKISLPTKSDQDNFSAENFDGNASHDISITALNETIFRGMKGKSYLSNSRNDCFQNEKTNEEDSSNNLAERKLPLYGRLDQVRSEKTTRSVLSNEFESQIVAPSTSSALSMDYYHKSANAFNKYNSTVVIGSKRI